MTRAATIASTLARIGGGALLAACVSGAPGEESVSTDEAAHSTTPEAGAPQGPVVDPDEGMPGCGASCAPATLPSCDAPMAVHGPLPVAVDFARFGTYDSGPLWPSGTSVRVALDGSPMWSTVQPGSATTGYMPSELGNASAWRAFRTSSGVDAIVYLAGSKVAARAHGAAGWGSEITLPCTASAVLNGACEAKAAGDGHLWVRDGSTLYEEIHGALENRGGTPMAPALWELDRQGQLTLVALEGGTATDLASIWRVAPGSGGWSRIGALGKAAVAAMEPFVVGGVRFGGGRVGAVADDGSIHLLSAASGYGEGERNKRIAHARSRDGRTWAVELLPETGALTDAKIAWRSVAMRAPSYDDVRVVLISSTLAEHQGSPKAYGERQFDVIARCRDATGKATWAPKVHERVPGLREGAFAAFSDSGVVSMLTARGVVLATP